MSANHYDMAVRDLDRSYTDSGEMAEYRLACAQVHATLALVDAIREQRTTTVGQVTVTEAKPLPDECADCGHNADAHDNVTGHCLVGLVSGDRCDCTGFEAQ